MDRAALDAAQECGVEAGGWCPAGRLAEDGRIPAKYQVRELESPVYEVRTNRGAHCMLQIAASTSTRLHQRRG